MQFKKLNNFLFLIFLYGCRVHEVDISSLEVSSDLNKTCHTTSTIMNVYSIQKNSSTKYELLSPKAQWCRDDIFMKSCKKAFEISKGGEIKITKIVNKMYGSSGHCWVVYAKAKNNQDIEFEIPSCFIDQNTDLWIQPKFPNKKVSQQLLQIKTDFIKEVKCSF